MSSKRSVANKVASLNDIIDILHNPDSDDDLPSEITIFPPENANTEVTDEDSGDEDAVSLQNLPGSQLRAKAEIVFDESSESEESEEDLLLSELAKRRRITVQSFPEDEEQQLPTTSDLVTCPSRYPTITPSVEKTKQYTWRNRHIPNEFAQWQNCQGPKNLQSPMYYYECMVNNEVIKLLVHYTNLYASQKNAVGNVTTAEMKCFLGILLYSGYIVVPRRYMYWEKSTDTNFDLVNNAMSRDQFHGQLL